MFFSCERVALEVMMSLCLFIGLLESVTLNFFPIILMFIEVTYNQGFQLRFWDGEGGDIGGDRG